MCHFNMSSLVTRHTLTSVNNTFSSFSSRTPATRRGHFSLVRCGRVHLLGDRCSDADAAARILYVASATCVRTQDSSLLPTVRG